MHKFEGCPEIARQVLVIEDLKGELIKVKNDIWFHTVICPEFADAVEVAKLYVKEIRLQNALKAMEELVYG